MNVRLFFSSLFRTRDMATQLYVLSFVLFVVGLILGVWFWFGTRGGADVTETVDEEQVLDEETVAVLDEDCEFRRFLDGVCVGSEEEQSVPIVSVMVENHTEARPLSGIAEASVVYEAPVEGHITRFMALYPRDTDVPKVGPVRSARPYYLDWLGEYKDAMYMHVGGSPEALEQITRFGVFDMNEFYRGWYFWRGKNRYAPHNVYTSSKLWQKAWSDYGDNTEQVTQPIWPFEERRMCDSACVDTISLAYLGNAYAPTWRFTSSTGKYVRSEFGRISRDEDGDIIEVDTLVLQRVSYRVLDNVGRLQLDTIGSGEVTVFRNGHAIEGTWHKTSRTEPTEFIDVDGHVISFAPGKIWINVVTPFVDVAY